MIIYLESYKELAITQPPEEIQKGENRKKNSPKKKFFFGSENMVTEYKAWVKFDFTKLLLGKSENIENFT